MKSIIIHIPSLKRDITYYVGSCAEDNDDVIDNASPDDFWFHVANKKSCHVSASVPSDIKRKDLKYIISQGAVLCKQNSYPSEKKIDILFTRIKHLQKTDVAGKVIVSEEHSYIKTC